MIKQLINLFQQEKESNAKLMKEMEWASVKSSPIKNKIKSSQTQLVYSESSDEKRKMTAHFSFL